MKKIQISLPTLAVAFVGVAMVIQLLTPDSVLRGDATVFADHADQMLSGRLPYFDFEFEHLPLAILPIGLAGIFERLVPGLDYNGAFVVLSTLVIVAIAVSVRRAGNELDDEGAAERWLLVAAPFFPFVLYRIDPWSVLFAVLAGIAVVRSHTGRYVTVALVGVATKGWPVLLAVSDWLGQRRKEAYILVGATAALGVGLLLVPGFRSGRSFEGVHLETISGSFVLLGRLMTDTPHGIEPNAGALYISVGVWAVGLNIVIGLSVWAVTMILLRRLRISRYLVLALAISGLLLASPLLSAQFLLWLTPFVALTRDRTAAFLTGACGVITTILLIWWDPISTGWAALLVIRNLALVGLVTSLILLAAKDEPARQATSL
ncbi:MAG: hypothetical protein GY788_22925 [bacterium]|nr:hypothetical protein [bacterium]